MPQIAEMGPDQLLIHFTNDCDLTAQYARCIACVSMLERYDRSIQFAFDLSEHDMRDLRDYSLLSVAMTCHSTSCVLWNEVVKEAGTYGLALIWS